MRLPPKDEQAPPEKLSVNRLLWVEAEKRAKAGLSQEQVDGLAEPTSCRRGGMCREKKFTNKDGDTTCALCHTERLHRLVRPGHYGAHPNAKVHRAEVAQDMIERREILDALRWEKEKAASGDSPGRLINGEEVSG
jgi:hypothetical protein